MLSGYVDGLLAQIGINLLSALAVYVILATGQLSLGNAAFMALGAYGASVLTVTMGMPLALALPIAAVSAGLCGVIVGFPALRLTGIYLAMATLGFGEIVRTFFLNFQPTGGAQGFYGMIGIGKGVIWAWALPAFVLVLVLERSRLWTELRAVFDDEFAAELAGLNTTAIKVAGFGAGGCLAGLAGGLLAHHAVYIEPGNFGFVASIEMVLFVILGGSTTAWGALLGAAALTLLPELLRSLADWRMAVFGALLVVILVVRPKGLVTRDMIDALLALPARGLRPWPRRADAVEGRIGRGERP